MNGPFLIRRGHPQDAPAIVTLLPQLADFELPERRRPEHLWHGDRDIVLAWAQGERDDVRVQVAEDAHGSIVGATVLSLGEEALSHEPSAHLEVIVVASAARRNGLGEALAHAAERQARSLGARSMTLHAFAANERARRLYARLGYAGELIRYIKPL